MNGLRAKKIRRYPTIEKTEVTINGKPAELILIGSIMDYDPRDPAETFKGTLMDSVWMDPETLKVYVHYDIFGEYREYDGIWKIAYEGSRFVVSSVEAAYEEEPVKTEEYYDENLVRDDPFLEKEIRLEAAREDFPGCSDDDLSYGIWCLDNNWRKGDEQTGVYVCGEDLYDEDWKNWIENQ